MSDDKEFERNSVAAEIEGRFRVGGDWVYGKEDADLVKLLKTAVDEIDGLQTYINTFCVDLDEAVKDERQLLQESILEWQESSTMFRTDAQKLRQAAQSYVTQFDKAFKRSTD